MQVTVNIYAQLRYHLRNSEAAGSSPKWEMPDAATVGQVLGRLKLPKGVLVTVLVNSNSVNQDKVLKEGDIIHILPQMGGG